jgi:hypothetical protein
MYIFHDARHVLLEIVSAEHGEAARVFRQFRHVELDVSGRGLIQ